ncbi:uncharacterized protein LOC134151970 isoform X2 [Rhea pennata]|uniref:uncharacterized protein LOC134151970 isoform X2 n=1 Tax=Rhea pennata TaxID=8795 RepID=UPI002E2731DE
MRSDKWSETNAIWVLAVQLPVEPGVGSEEMCALNKCSMSQAETRLVFSAVEIQGQKHEPAIAGEAAVDYFFVVGVYPPPAVEALLSAAGEAAPLRDGCRRARGTCRSARPGAGPCTAAASQGAAGAAEAVPEQLRLAGRVAERCPALLAARQGDF